MPLKCVYVGGGGGARIRNPWSPNRFLGAFPNSNCNNWSCWLRNLSLSLSANTSVCLHITTREQWTDFHEILCWRVSVESVDTCQFWLESRNNNDLFTYRPTWVSPS
jgi:hypothetical protein